jgi:anti-anti-sigma factor
MVGDIMEIEKKYNDKELTIEVGNRIDTVTAPDFENEIMDEMGKFDSLILDLEKLEYISSAGLRVLVLVQKKLQPEGIPFVIINVNDTIKEIFSMSGFDKILTIK